MRKFLLLLAACFISAAAFAQDFPYGQQDNAALDMRRYDKDTSAHAVVLNEHGISRITVNNLDNIRLEYTYHTKIKFFDDKDFESEGTFEIPVYSSDGQTYEEVTEIKGVTFYKDDNGLVQKVELDPKKVFRVKEDKHHTLVKFAMPGLRKGCVIEVSYQLESPYDFNFQNWEFQGYIPKVFSEYEAHIPGFWNYNASLRGYLKLDVSKAEIERDCFSFHGAAAGCSFLTYGMHNVPAFAKEEYMTSPKNYMSAINFQLVEFTDFNTGGKIKFTKEWKDVDYELKSAYWFGGQLKKKDLLKDHIGTAIAGKTDSLEKAKAVYAFIQKSFKWNDRDDMGSVDGIRKALDARTGNAGDINLALVTALNSANIPTEAVLVSTRTNGSINKLYPSPSEFNYVIARTNIGGKTYMLDATEPLLSFGMLPLRCLNDQGRVFSLDKPSYWIDMVTPQRESTTYNFDLTLQDDGKLKGTLNCYSSGYSGYLKRGEIKKFNSVDEYVEHISGEMPKIKIAKSNITNIDTLDKTLDESYDIEVLPTVNGSKDNIRFSPFLIDQMKTNPFKLAQRDFPVDWGMPSEERYIVTVHLPAQYTVENPPQGVNIALPNQGGNFITDYQSDSNVITFSYVTKISKSIYSPEEYPYLKELFNKVIAAEKNEIVIKKK
ncbi:MAG: transglutaminase domain-containing protein [Sphingobacteriales bacterium]